MTTTFATYKYEQGYRHGREDATNLIPPRVSDRSLYGEGYRDGYLDAGRPVAATLSKAA